MLNVLNARFKPFSWFKKDFFFFYTKVYLSLQHGLKLITKSNVGLLGIIYELYVVIIIAMMEYSGHIGGGELSRINLKCHFENKIEMMRIKLTPSNHVRLSTTPAAV